MILLSLKLPYMEFQIVKELTPFIKAVSENLFPETT